LYLADGGHFLIRYHKNVTFTADPSRPARTGVDEAKRPYREEWGWLGSKSHRLRRYVRRITLERAGAESILLVTDLGVSPDEAPHYPATDLLAAYLMRWNIERVFQQVTEVYNLRGLIGTTPRATVFQFAFCLVLYNILQLVKTYIAAGAKKELPEVSSEKVFADMQDQMIGWNVLIDPAETVRLIEPLDAATTRARLSELLSGIWTDRWRKSKPRKRQPPQHTGKRCHASAFRMIEKATSARTKTARGAERK
jgi:hypothetical protein